MERPRTAIRYGSALGRPPPGRPAADAPPAAPGPRRARPLGELFAVHFIESNLDRFG